MARQAEQPDIDVAGFNHTFCTIILKKILEMERAGKFFLDMHDPDNMPLSALGAACLNHLMGQIMQVSPGYVEHARISMEEYRVMIKTATKFLGIFTARK